MPQWHERLRPRPAFVLRDAGERHVWRTRICLTTLWGHHDREHDDDCAVVTTSSAPGNVVVISVAR
jgi:hypothetical protein